MFSWREEDERFALAFSLDEVGLDLEDFLAGAFLIVGLDEPIMLFVYLCLALLVCLWSVSVVNCTWPPFVRGIG